LKTEGEPVLDLVGVISAEDKGVVCVAESECLKKEEERDHDPIGLGVSRRVCHEISELSAHVKSKPSREDT
jgi:hypothetical protein